MPLGQDQISGITYPSVITAINKKIAPEIVTLCGEGSMCYDTQGGAAKKLCENTKKSTLLILIITYYLYH